MASKTKAKPDGDPTVKALQEELKREGFYAGETDGLMGKGTRDAIEAKRKKESEDREFELRKGEGDAKRKKDEAEARAAESEAAEKERKTKARLARAEEAGSARGIATEIASTGLAPVAGTAVGMGLGKGTNYMMDVAQKGRNEVLKGVAADRLAGLTTREGAREGARLAGAIPLRNPALRTAARMSPHLGLGAIGVGKGMQMLGKEDPENNPFYSDMANRALGMGYIGTGAGLAKQGWRYGTAPGVVPDARSIGIISSNQLRRNGLPGADIEGPTVERANALNRGPMRTIDAEVIPDEPKPKALPKPEGAPVKRGHAERLIGAAKAAGATGIKSKAQAAEWLAANLSEENRAAVAKELGIKPGTNFSKRISTAIKNMASKPGASGLLAPIAGGAIAYSATPADAASEGSLTGQDEALTNAGIVTGIGAGTGYGIGRTAQALGPAAGKALSGGMSMMGPIAAADAYDPTQEKLNKDRNDFVQWAPSWARIGELEGAYQMAQVPERGERGLLGRRDLNAAALPLPQGISPTATRDADLESERDAMMERRIQQALGVVGRARGGRVSGGLHYDTGGRTDVVPMDVERGTYIVPADVVSALGQGNTLAGIKVLDNMFPPPSVPESAPKRASGGRADETAIPIIAAGGEYAIDPYHVAMLGDGDVGRGADALDAFVQETRQQHIDTLSSLPGPAGGDDEKKKIIGRGLDIAARADGGSVISEEEAWQQMDPIEQLRLSMPSSWAPVSEEQAGANREQNLRDLLSIVPGPGNVIAAEDALTQGGEAASALGEGSYGKAALHGGLGLLSGLGAVTGLPTSRMAGNAARGARDVAPAFPAWHGSPHDFDEFKLDKIGTGEGAQAYGHGLYFAENPDVAMAYREALAKKHQLNPLAGQMDDIRNAVDWLRAGKKGDLPAASQEQIDNAISDLRNDYVAGPFPNPTDKQIADHLESSFAPRGRLYRAEIDAEPHQLLDWDKPLNQQHPDVQQKLNEILKPSDRMPDEWIKHSPGAEQRLREAGIPGIRYLDQGSRGAADVNDIRGSLSMWERALQKSPNDSYARQQVESLKGQLADAEKALTSNYVIFDDKLVKIKGKE